MGKARRNLGPGTPAVPVAMTAALALWGNRALGEMDVWLAESP